MKFDFSNDSAEDIYTLFDKNFKELYDKWFIKAQKANVKSSFLRTDWISIGVANSSDVKNLLYDNWVKNRTRLNWNKYIDYKNVYESIKDKEKFDYYDKCFKNNQYDLANMEVDKWIIRKEKIEQTVDFS